MSRGSLRVRVVLVVAVGALLTLLWLDPMEAAPRSLSWAALDTWYGEVGPSVAALVVVRLGAIAASLWLLLACLLQVASVTAIGRVVGPLADRVVPATLRGLAGASLSATLLTTTSLVAGADDGPGTATMHPMSGDEVTTSSTTGPPTSTPPPLATDPPAVPAVPVPVVPDTYTVSRSESFWSIAVDRMSEVLRRSPAEGEVQTYWVRLIEANRERLVDPGNADLLYSGQVLVLPPVG